MEHALSSRIQCGYTTYCARMFVHIFHLRLLCLPVCQKIFTVPFSPSTVNKRRKKYKMLSQVKLLVTIITISTYVLSEIHCGVVDKSRASKSSMVRHTVNSMENSTKINSTLPLISSQTKQQSPSQLNPKSLGEVTNIKRKGKIFSDLSFLTGLGIGSLATSAIIPAGTKLSSSGIAERLQQTTIPTLMDSATTISSTQPVIATTGQQLSLAPALSHELMNVLDQAHPYYLSLSNNNLLYQTLKSMQDLLERLKNQPKEFSSFGSFTPTSPMPPVFALTPPSSFTTNKRTVAWNPDVYNELNESDGTSETRVIKKSDGHIGGLNCSALKDIIRETIKETKVFNDRRQAEPMEETTTESSTMVPEMTTTTMSTSTTQISPPQSTTTGHSGYYGGHGQNLNGINLVSHQYPSTSYGYPNFIHNAYGPPVYPSDSYHHHHHHQQHQEYYNPEIVDEYPSDTSISSANHFQSVPDQWPIYPPLARARKLSRTDDDKLVIRGNGFVPSQSVG